MGSSSKSSNNHNHSPRGNNYYNNNKPYALMLLLAFGAAILGVMVLHKLREKRIFTLLVKEKDHELLTLHLFLQKEREFNQEAQKKIEDMKNKVYPLRTQKLELDRRLLEMESTISALKDERKVIELTLEEKKNQIQMLTSVANSSTGDSPQVTALLSMIKKRDEEIQDLKFHLKKHIDLQFEQAKQETISTSVSTRQENEHDGESLHSSDSFSDLTKAENRSQNGAIIQRVNDHTSTVEPEKLNNEKIAEVHLKTNIENKDREGTDFHGNQDDKVIEGDAKGTSTSHDEEQHRLRMRRKHSKGRRRETLRNRKLGDEEQQKLGMHQDEKANSETEKELSRKDQLALPDGNPKAESGEQGQSREEEAEKSMEERERKPPGIKPNGNDTKHGSLECVKTELDTDGWRAKSDDVDENFRMQITDEINKQLKHKEVNRKQEMLHSIKLKKHENNNDNEQGNATTIEEGEVEDAEDAEIHEPELDRDDIRRFSESDPDEEANETEF